MAENDPTTVSSTTAGAGDFTTTPDSENAPAQENTDADDGATPGEGAEGPDAENAPTFEKAMNELDIEARLAFVENAIAALMEEPEPELPDARGARVAEDMLARLDNTFSFHPAGPDQARRYEHIRARARAFAQVIVTLTPASREQSLAITALEEAVMRANQAIALNE